MVEVTRVNEDRLAEYDSIPMVRRVESRFAVHIRDGGLGGFEVVEESVSEPSTVDDRALAPEGVQGLAERFDTSHWAFFLATLHDHLVGGAVAATRTEGIGRLDGRDDLALLLDIRVAAEAQRRGVGKALFEQVVAWSRAEGMTQLKIETQNTNVGACRFYAAQGCELRGIIHHAYAASGGAVADEVELQWWLDL